MEKSTPSQMESNRPSPYYKPYLPFKISLQSPKDKHLAFKKGFHHSSNISLIHNENINTNLKKLFGNLHHFKRITAFNSKLSTSSNTEVLVLYNLLAKLSHKQIKRLKLSIPLSALKLENEVFLLYTCLKRFPRLSSLNISSPNSQNAQRNSIVSLRKNMKTLKNLNTLNIELITHQRLIKYNTTIYRLFNGAKIDNLVTLSLSIQRFQIDLNAFLPDFMNKLVNINTLQNLKLNLGENSIKPEIFIKSFSLLSQFSQLKRLNLHLQRNFYEDVLFRSISSIQTLQSLCLAFVIMSKENFIDLAKCIAALPYLTEVKLCFFCYYAATINRFNLNITDPLFKALYKHSETLETFHFQLFELDINSNSTSKARPNNELLELSKFLTSCKNLTDLQLGFTSQFYQEELLYVTTALSKISTLKTLFLYLKGPLNITPDFFSSVTSSLSHNPLLQNLTLLLEEFGETPDQVIVDLGHEIAKLKDLQEIKLQLIHFPKLTAASLQFLLEDLRNMNGLKLAKLCFQLNSPRRVPQRQARNLGDFTFKINDRVIQVTQVPFYDVLLDLNKVIMF